MVHRLLLFAPKPGAVRLVCNCHWSYTVLHHDSLFGRGITFRARPGAETGTDWSPRPSPRVRPTGSQEMAAQLIAASSVISIPWLPTYGSQAHSRTRVRGTQRAQCLLRLRERGLGEGQGFHQPQWRSARGGRTHRGEDLLHQSADMKLRRAICMLLSVRQSHQHQHQVGCA